MRDGTTPQLPELMCHVNVDLDRPEAQAIFGICAHTASRLDDPIAGDAGREVPGRFRISARIERAARSSHRCSTTTSSIRRT